MTACPPATPDQPDTWPRLISGRWVASPLAALGLLAASTCEPMVAVRVDLLREAAAWRECSARTTLTDDEDGPLRTPIEIVCRRQEGHDDPRNPQHIRTHHSGYAGWEA